MTEILMKEQSLCRLNMLLFTGTQNIYRTLSEKKKLIEFQSWYHRNQATSSSEFQKLTRQQERIALKLFSICSQNGMLSIIHIVGMCFDTTASNTGVLNGACVLLEQKIGRPLLALACRHHIFEIILGAVFSIKLGPTTGPAYTIFSRFQKEWKQIDKQKFQPGISNELVKKSLADVGDDIIMFCKRELEKPIIRHDYQELLQSVIQNALNKYDIFI